MHTFKATAMTCPLIVLLSGCLLVAGAAVGAGAVHVLGEDAAEVNLERDWDTVFNAGVDAVETLGSVETQDREAGVIEGHVKEADVTVKLEQVTKSTVKVVVEARKNEGVSPAPEIAQDVSHAIAERTGY